MPADNGSPLIAVSYETVARTNFDFWMRFAWNARRFGYSCVILCERSLRPEHEEHLKAFHAETGASVQVFVTHASTRSKQLRVMREFNDIPDIWIDVEPGCILPISELSPTLVEKNVSENVEDSSK